MKLVKKGALLLKMPTIVSIPTTIKNITAMTLIIESQYSVSPKELTVRTFIKNIINKTANENTHNGTL